MKPIANCGLRIADDCPQSAVRSRGALLFLGISLFLGCHRYEPVTAVTVQPGANVSVALTDFGTANLGRLLGMGVGTIEGSMVTLSDSALVMAVQVVRQRDGIESFWKGERVAIPRTDIAEIRQRRFSRSKSAVAGVALIAAAVGAVEAFIGTGAGAQPPGVGGGGGGPR